MKMILLLLSLPAVLALDNGFDKPALGWSSWFAAKDGSKVTDAFVRASAQALISSGLAAKGFKYVNVDEGWLKGRSPNGTIYEDRVKFPAGMKALGDWVTAQPVAAGSAEKLVYGLYTCRGTCQCGTNTYSGPGSNGHEAADTQWMIDAGARWLKIDSCCGSQDHSVAISDYSKFRDAMNKSGEQVWFNLCGWHNWYAEPDPSINFTGGQSLGNSYRISEDGGNWGSINGGITQVINYMSYLAQYTHPGGYPDMDNIVGPHSQIEGGVTESQARAQMVLWSIMPTQLILGEDVTQMSDEYIATVGNEELIAVNQDTPLVGAAKRIVGGNLDFPCNVPHGPVPPPGPMPKGCIVSPNGTTYKYAAGSLFPGKPDHGGNWGPSLVSSEQCCALCQSFKNCTFWTYSAGGTPGKPLCYNEPGGCCFLNTAAAAGGESTNCPTCTAGSTSHAPSAWEPAPTPASNAHCENVWARPLSDGGVALAMLNNGENSTIICNATCFGAAGLGGAKKLKVRDMIAHADLPELSPPFVLTAFVAGHGAAAAFRLTPVE